ncbi:MAG TPA: hypothetical protein VGM88_02765 [Kofleriaceae bacterium]|jgi:hypothetical protein
MRFALLLLVACGSAPPASKPAPPPPPKAPPAWQVLKLSDPQQKGLDLAANQIGKLRVLVASPPPGEPAPLLCSRLGDKATFCLDGTCRELDGAPSTLVVCNADTFRALDALILAEHDTDAWPKVNDSDVTLRAMFDRVARDPAAAVATLHPNADPDHIALHWYLLGMYAIGHATKHPLLPGFSDTPHAVALPDARVCTNYTKSGESDRWLAERAVDEQTERLMYDAYDHLAETDPGMAHRSLEELSGDLLITAQWQWYRRQGALLARACPAVATQPFALMRCNCRAPDHWTQIARGMLPDEERPFTLAATSLLLGLLEHAKENASDQFSARVLALGAIQDAVLTIGRHACDPKTDRTGEIPALEGYRYMNAPTPLFHPTAEQLADVERACR